MIIETICTRHVDLVEPHETVTVAAHRMLQRDVGSLLVVDSERRPLGIVTDRDLTVKVLAAGLSADDVPIRDVITGPVSQVLADSPIEAGLRIMRDDGVRRLPVVDADGSLVGIVTLDDIIVWVSEQNDLVRGVVRAAGTRATSKPAVEPAS